MVASRGRDIVVMGTSMGGVEAVSECIAGLPVDLAAAVFVVHHPLEKQADSLVQLLRSRTELRVDEALHGERIEHGRIYVAPPDNHVLVREGHVAVVRGPKENGHRPCVNALFRTAASAYGPRVVAVVLTGELDCGTLGLLAVKARGGVAIAQNPLSATRPDMPAAAIQSGAVDHVLELNRIAPLIVELVREAPSEESAETLDVSARSSFVTCPLCNGSMLETAYGETAEFSCHVGHTFSFQSLCLEQADQLESTFWAAIRALEDSATLARRMAQGCMGAARSRLDEKERIMTQHATTLRNTVLTGSHLARSDIVGTTHDDSRVGATVGAR